jgi:hypothetical protein
MKIRPVGTELLHVEGRMDFKTLVTNSGSLKSTAQADNIDQFAINCTGHSNFYTDIRRLHLQIKLQNFVDR